MWAKIQFDARTVHASGRGCLYRAWCNGLAGEPAWLGVSGGLSRKILIAINSHHSEPGLADIGILEQLDQPGRAIVNFVRIIPYDKLGTVGLRGHSY